MLKQYELRKLKNPIFKGHVTLKEAKQAWLAEEFEGVHLNVIYRDEIGHQVMFTLPDYDDLCDPDACLEDIEVHLF